MSPQDIQEETFWNTPGAGARTLHFKGDSLLDEKVDFGMGLGGAMDFISPGPTPGPSVGLSTSDGGDVFSPLGYEPPPNVPSSELEDQELDEGPDETVLGATDADEEDDATVMLGKPLKREPGLSLSTPPAASAIEVSPEEENPPALSVEETPSNASKRTKVKVTTELERAVVSTSFFRVDTLKLYHS